MSETVVLRGSGAVGLVLGVNGLTSASPTLMASTVAETVKLGAVLRPAVSRPKVVRLERFIDVTKSTPPRKVDYSAKAMESLNRMYRNNARGCCVISGTYHQLGTWSANDSNQTIVVDDSTIDEMYDLLKAGPGDSGCIITDVLDYHMRTGMKIPTGRNRIDGYVSVDWTNWDMVMRAVFLGGALKIGFAIPEEWLNSDTWDITNSQIMGGHDVAPIGYDDDYLYVSSWGRVYRIAKRAVTSRRYLSEMYLCLDVAWYGSDKLTPAGVDVNGLVKAMDDFKNGRLPDWDSPTPVPPGPDPVPPTPPSPPVPPPPAPIKFPTYTGAFPVRGPFGQVDWYQVTLNPSTSELSTRPAARLSWDEFYNVLSRIQQVLESLGFTEGKLQAMLKIVVADLIAGKDATEILKDLLAAYGGNDDVKVSGEPYTLEASVVKAVKDLIRFASGNGQVLRLHEGKSSRPGASIEFGAIYALENIMYQEPGQDRDQSLTVREAVDKFLSYYTRNK